MQPIDLPTFALDAVRHLEHPAPAVLLVMLDDGLAAALRRSIRALSPRARIAVDREPVDALLTAARMDAGLVVVDTSLPFCSGPAMRRHLARIVPQAQVIVVDDGGDEVAADGVSWPEAERRVADWLVDWQLAVPQMSGA